jgi:2-keto-3-deoxy-L-rhamnonate aldolase RhmA
MGLMGQVDHPQVMEAIDRVARACQRRDLSLGYFGTTAESVQDYVSKGYRLICAGTDAGFVVGGAEDTLQKLRG